MSDKQLSEKGKIEETKKSASNLQKLIDELNASSTIDGEKIESSFKFKLVEENGQLFLFDENENFTINYEEDMAYMYQDIVDEFGGKMPEVLDTITPRIEEAVKADFGKDAYIEWEDTVRMIVVKDASANKKKFDEKENKISDNTEKHECPQCHKILGDDGRCYNAECDEYDPLSQYYEDLDANQDLMQKMLSSDVPFVIAKDEDDKQFLIFYDWEDVRKIQKIIKPDFESSDENDTSILDGLQNIGWGFGDEWAKCDECDKLIRTSPDSYSFKPDYWLSDKLGILCGDCVRNNHALEYAQSLINNAKKANTVLSSDDLENLDFTLIEKDFEDGWYDRHDSPEEILNTALEKHPEGAFLFSISGVGQFATQFELWGADIEEKDEEEDDEHLVERPWGEKERIRLPSDYTHDDEDEEGPQLTTDDRAAGQWYEELEESLDEDISALQKSLGKKLLPPKAKGRFKFEIYWFDDKDNQGDPTFKLFSSKQDAEKWKEKHSKDEDKFNMSSIEKIEIDESLKINESKKRYIVKMTGVSKKDEQEMGTTAIVLPYEFDAEDENDAKRQAKAFDPRKRILSVELKTKERFTEADEEVDSEIDADSIQVYEFPSEFKNYLPEVKRLCKEHDLKFLGKGKNVIDNVAEPDFFIEGRYADLVAFADELDYALHPDYLCHADEFAYEDILIDKNNSIEESTQKQVDNQRDLFNKKTSGRSSKDWTKDELVEFRELSARNMMISILVYSAETTFDDKQFDELFEREIKNKYLGDFLRTSNDIYPAISKERLKELWNDMVKDFKQAVVKYAGEDSEGVQYNSIKYLDESVQEDRKELDYLWRKEKVTNLDKYERYKLQELIQKYGRPDRAAGQWYESLEEAVETKQGFTKEEATQFAKELTQKFFDDGGYYDIWADEGAIQAQIYWGDWKHDHLYFKSVVQKFFDDLDINIKIDSEVTEEDGSDVYSALHTIRKV